MPNTRLTPDQIQRSAIHAALGDPHRLAIVEALLHTDRAPSDLAHDLGLESNLFTHHVDQLERVGIVRRIRSTGDGRRRYLTLVRAALDSPKVTSQATAGSVLFVCTENSARSQLAAAILRSTSQVQVASAGTHPAKSVHPQAVRVAARHGLDLSGAKPAHLQTVGFTPDFLITVCDRAHEELQPPAGHRLHWSVPDPAAANTPAAFERAFRDIAERVDSFVRSLGPSPRLVREAQ